MQIVCELKNKCLSLPSDNLNLKYNNYEENLRICFMNKIRNQPSNNQYVTFKKYAVLINNSKNLAQLKK